MVGSVTVDAVKRLLLLDDLTPVAAYAAIRGPGPSFLLESAPIGGERWGRYSVIGSRPRRLVTLDLVRDGTAVRLRVEDANGPRILAEITAERSRAMRLLREHAFDPATPLEEDAPRVVDAAVGYLAYDLVHALEPVAPFPGERRLARLMVGATFVVFDAVKQTVAIYGEDEGAIEQTVAKLSAPQRRLAPLDPPTRDATPENLTTSMDDEAFAERVRRAQRYIEAGDVFQVVLARSFTTPRVAGVDPFDVYRALRVLNPSPYLYYLELGASDGAQPEAIAGASPETLVRLEDREITVRPIAGTRPRGADEALDRVMEDELLRDPKERAEHVMLVDLGRNDVGRVSSIGSVHVPVQMTVERYSHVMHLVSEVHGRLAADKDAWDLLAATFPAGTLSGAPKVRAMQIIRELEATPRGVYGGAIGYVSRHGTMDFAIAIRTLVAFPDRFEVSAGAGVVEASVPSLEAAETRHKARATLSALSAALREK
jgi:anthranilate synthase component 1